MFCNACGTENIEGAAYCSACGAKLNSPVKTSNNGNQNAINSEKAAFDARIELAEEVSRIYKQVATQVDNYSKVISLRKEINTTNQALEANSKLMPSEKLSQALLLFILYVVVVSVIGFLLDQTGNYPTKTCYGGPAVMIAPFLLLPSIVCLISYVAGKHRKVKDHNLLTQRLASSKEAANETATEIIENYNSIRNNFFDFSNADPNTVYMVYQIISSGRADSVKEALQYLDEMKHKQVMEQIAIEQLNISKQILNQAIAIHESLDFISLMSSITAARC